MVALDLATVIHLDGAPDWVLDDDFLADFDRDNPRRDIEAGSSRWRDFVDAGLHVASATDAPWTFPDFEEGDRLVELTDDMGRPVDQIAAGMDGGQRMNPETPPWLLDQLLTAEQGLRAVTLDAAWALGDEARRGHLAPGTLGDVTILSGDITAAPRPTRSGPCGRRHDRRWSPRLLRRRRNLQDRVTRLVVGLVVLIAVNSCASSANSITIAVGKCFRRAQRQHLRDRARDWEFRRRRPDRDYGHTGRR